MSASCNLLRLRTCVDTISHLTEVAKSVASTASSVADSSDNSTSRQSTAEPSDMPSVDSVNDEDIVPDLADAMAELDAVRKTSDVGPVSLAPEGKSVLKKVSKKSGGQVFFFPDESQKLAMEASFPPSLGMMESFYDGRGNDVEASDDSIDLDEFCFLDAIGTGFTNTGEASVHNLDGEDPVVFVENHFPVPEKSIDYLKTPQGFPAFQSRITLKRISVQWQIFGGKDLTPGTSFTVLGGGGVAVDRSILLSTIVGKGGLAEALKTRGGPQRIESQLIEVHLHQLSAQHELYPDSCREASRQIVILKSFEIVDKLAASDFNKLLHLYTCSTLPRQSNSNMFSLKCVNLRPDGGRGPIPEETNLSLSLQPLRLNIDQDTLLFIVDFFSSLFPALSDVSPAPASGLATVGSGSSPGPSVDECRGMTIRYTRESDAVEIQPQEVAQEAAEEEFEDSHEEAQVGGELDEEDLDRHPRERSSSPAQPSASQSSSQASRTRQPYIRTFVFSRDVPIRIDYSAKYLDLSQVNHLCIN